MKTLFTLLFTLFVLLGHAQMEEVKFGDISKEDLEMESYDKDPSARAVVLYDKGKSVFFDKDGSYDIRFTRHRRIKIFDKSETQPTEVSIPFYSDGYGKSEKIRSIKATTYYLDNGQLVKKTLDPSSIYEEQISKQWNQKKFVFPDVQNGAVLEYMYVFETPFHFNLPDWSYQDRIPTMYSEYELRLIPFYEYVYSVQGVSKFDYESIRDSKEERQWGSIIKNLGQDVGNGIKFVDKIHTYVLRDVPAFKDESYISSIDDYIIKHEFQLAKFTDQRGNSTNIISTWPELNESLLKHDDFGKYLKNASKIGSDILEEELQISDLTDSEKAKTIIEYIKTNFAWNGQDSKYASQSAKKFYANKSGNSADINLFMIALLNEAGVDTKPLIISTRKNGKINISYPFNHYTNYVLALVNIEKTFVGDGTDELLSYSKLPIRCYNVKGLVVNESEEPEWIQFKNTNLSEERHFITLSIDPNSSDINCSLLIQEMGYESYHSRKKFKNDTLLIKEHFDEDLENITSVKSSGYDKIAKPYSIQIKSTYKTEKLNDDIIIQPFLNLPISKNYLTQKDRTYPVDFVYPWKDSFDTKLDIPDGYTINELPDNFEVDNDLVNISVQHRIDSNQLISKGNYTIKKDVYESDEYQSLRQHFDDIVKYFNHSLLLEKM